MKIEIKSVLGALLFEGDFSCLSEAVSAAVKARADLSRAYLSGADLSGAYLSGADLSGAYLSGAYLSGAYLSAFAQVAFKGHGECGRMLTAFRQTDGGPVVFQCGCFYGSEDELLAYIEKGDAAYKKSRRLALNVVKQLLDFQD